jgi:putative flippase GtrA
MAHELDPRLRRVAVWMATLPVVGTACRRLAAKPKELERFCKFAVVGAIGAVVDFVVLNIMKVLFEQVGLGVGWNPEWNVDVIQLVAANTISFSAAVLSNFTWNRLWTFPESRDLPLGSQLGQFAIVNICGWGINTLLLVSMDQFVFQRFVSARLSYNLAKAFAIGVVLFWNFGVNRIWTYKEIE